MIKGPPLIALPRPDRRPPVRRRPNSSELADFPSRSLQLSRRHVGRVGSPRILSGATRRGAQPLSGRSAEPPPRRAAPAQPEANAAEATERAAERATDSSQAHLPATDRYYPFLLTSGLLSALACLPACLCLCAAAACPRLVSPFPFIS